MKALFKVASAAFLFACAAVLVFAAELTAPDDWPLDHMRQATVYVGESGSDSHGSGVIIGPRTILTAAHVVAGLDNGILVRLSDGGYRVAIVGWSSPTSDIALLVVTDPLEEAPAEIACAAPAWGQEVAIVGHPLRLDWAMSLGFVSSVDPVDMEDANARQSVPVMAAVNPGNSGGPVFDRQGRVVGLANAYLTTPVGFMRAPSGIAMMLPAARFCPLLLL